MSSSHELEDVKWAIGYGLWYRHNAFSSSHHDFVVKDFVQYVVSDIIH